MTSPATEAALGLARWRPRITPPFREVDADAVELAAAALLRALGVDLDDPNVVETPRRMAHAYTEMLTVPEFAMTTFPNDEGYDELVLVENIPVQSLCEHHMLPFVGVAHVGYLPGDRILGLSKFARLVEFHARHPQTQERLTKRIADHLQRQLSPYGVGVVIEAEHTCMSLRGARVAGARTVTSALFGQLRDDPASRAEFLALARPSRGTR
jgi:GTP cyclohydrolase I